MAEFIFFRSYSRWIESKSRRETWEEAVDRYMTFMKSQLKSKLSEQEYHEISESILHQKVMPSMRLFWSAGEVAHKNNIFAYNCAFIVPQNIDDIVEIMYLLLCGVGVGFSVEITHIKNFPTINLKTHKNKLVHVITDNLEGWCQALRLGLEAWFNGQDIAFDFSYLKQYSDRKNSSPLKRLLDFCRKMIFESNKTILSSLDWHDIICMIGKVISEVGIRRAALISLSSLDDPLLKDAKNNDFFVDNPQRSYANNSVAYNKKPTPSEFNKEWEVLRKSGTGERGIFNRSELLTQIPKRRAKYLTNVDLIGTNPCGEIYLNSKQFCNLSEVIVRENDTEDELTQKIKIATIIGTFQSTLTNFSNLSPEWKKNSEAERLLGVSLTGLWDNTKIFDSKILQNLKNYAIKTNIDYAKKFGIKASTAITCIKPSGTVSLLVNTSPGIHPRYARYYIRRVRVASRDPLAILLINSGVPYFPEVGQDRKNASIWVFEFPLHTPGKSQVQSEIDAISQLNKWKLLKNNYTEHNPSTTILLAHNEWKMTSEWILKNWNSIGGLAFLPKDQAVYKLAPHEEISEEEYEKRIEQFPKIDYSLLTETDKTQWLYMGPAGCEGDDCSFI